MSNEENNDFQKNDEVQNAAPSSDINNDVKPVDKNIIDNNSIINKSYVQTKKNGLLKVTAIGLACIFGCGAVGLGIGVGSSLTNNFLNKNSAPTNNNFSFQDQNQNIPQQQTQIPYTAPSSNNMDAASIINTVAKSVVSIDTVVNSNSDFGSIFGIPSQQRGSGSGIIFHQDNDKIYIVTNCHVIDGADAVNISIEKSLAVPAKPVGKNPQADLAVICVEKKELQKQGIANVTVARFGDSDKIRVGENILAIGNALGEGNTVTSGIVSAKDKKINVDNRQLSVIQIDAPINPGNSGGALINNSGEVIGITTAKSANKSITRYTEPTIEGMSYCLPINDVKPAIEDIINEPNKPFLGIRGLSITKEISENYGLPNMGVLINEIIDNSNAKKYGLQVGDIITMLDGSPVYTIEELSSKIKQHHINDRIKLHVMRMQNGQINGLDLEVTLEAYMENNF